jgi:hypothetical protein
VRADAGNDVFGLGVMAGLLLGKHEVVADDHLEDATSRGNQGELGEIALKLGEELGRQTDGSGSIASFDAILDRHPHAQLV